MMSSEVSKHTGMCKNTPGDIHYVFVNIILVCELLDGPKQLFSRPLSIFFHDMKSFCPNGSFDSSLFGFTQWDKKNNNIPLNN